MPPESSYRPKFAKPAIRFLTKHAATRTAQLGWEELKNGDLLDAAEKHGFEVMVTCERNLKYQQNPTGRSIGIVVLPSGCWPAVKAQIEDVVQAVDRAQPGIYWEISLKRSALRTIT